MPTFEILASRLISHYETAHLTIVAETEDMAIDAAESLEDNDQIEWVTCEDEDVSETSFECEETEQGI